MWTHRRSGQVHQRGSHDYRDPYERDKTRVIHCSAFRRMQHKTQILGTHEGDFHRTRLTHSLEVASIGTSIARSLGVRYQQHVIAALLPTDDLIQAISLLHDIGHPPFGHGGEVALNYEMRQYGGFESNAQSLRLLTKIENSYGGYGLDLTRRTLLGILKYPVARCRVVAPRAPVITASFNKTIRINDWLPPKGYFDSEQAEVDWLLMPLSEADRQLFQSVAQKPRGKKHGRAAYHSFDCSIMDIADNIAYGVHDLEDAVHLHLIGRPQVDTQIFRRLLSACKLASNTSAFVDALFHESISIRKQAIGELVNYFITAITLKIMHEDFDNPLLKYNVVLSEEAQDLLDYLMQCVYNEVIDSHDSRTFEYGGQTVVLRLFDAISSNPACLLDTKNRVLFHEAFDEATAIRIVCDYIANMTDEYAYYIHERLFGFNARTVFEK